MDSPRLIPGDTAIDDRGKLAFVNDFDFTGIKRAYTVSNHRVGYVRGWHGHKIEAKYVSVVTGASMFGVVQIDDWDNPSKSLKISKFVLSETKPSVLYIPPGHAHGFMSLTADTRVIFYSTSTLADSLNDDFRYDARYWDCWTVEER